MGDFKCESEVFNGPVCAKQCMRCAHHWVTRIALVGLQARIERVAIDLGKDISRKVITVQNDQDMYRIYGFLPQELKYVAMGITSYQRDWLKAHRHEEISMEDAREWLREPYV